MHICIYIYIYISIRVLVGRDVRHMQMQAMCTYMIFPHACSYTYMYIHNITYLYMHVQYVWRTYICLWICIDMYTYIIIVCTTTCMYIYIYIYIFVSYMCICTKCGACMYIYIYIYILNQFAFSSWHSTITYRYIHLISQETLTAFPKGFLIEGSKTGEHLGKNQKTC